MVQATINQHAGDNKVELQKHCDAKSLQTVSLLFLPTEIWIAIGQHLIDHLDPMPWSPWVSEDTALQNSRLKVPPLLQVCHSLRDELLPYYYRTKVHLFVHDDNFPWVVERMGQWLRGIGREARKNIGQAWICMSRKELDEIGLRRVWWGVEFDVEEELRNWTLQDEPGKRADLIAYLWRRRIVFR